MDHQVPGAVAETQRGPSPGPARAIECESHVPWGLIVVYNCFFGALTPHTDNRICAQTVSKRRFVHLDAQQLPPPLLLYTKLARFRTHYESPASLNARRHSQVSCLAGRADRVVSAVGRSGTAARRPAYSRACSCAFCSTIVHSRTRDSPSLGVLRK